MMVVWVTNGLDSVLSGAFWSTASVAYKSRKLTTWRMLSGHRCCVCQGYGDAYPVQRRRSATFYGLNPPRGIWNFGTEAER